MLLELLYLFHEDRLFMGAESCATRIYDKNRTAPATF
jgi:hypothetical protein